MTYLLSIIIISLFYQKYKYSLALYDLSKKRERKRFCVIVSLILSLLLIVRNDYFGTDTQNYHHLFDTINVYYDTAIDHIELSSEWGFYSLMYYLQNNGFSFRFLLAISAISYMVGVSYLIYKYSENVLFSYFIFFTYNFWVFNTTMRQCFALTFIIGAVVCAIHKRLVPYMFFLILAMMFHATAIVCIPIYWVVNMKFSRRNVLLFFMVMIVISVFSSSIFSSMQEMLGKEYNEMQASGYVRTIIMVMLLIVALLNRRKLSEANGYFTKMFLMALCLQPIAQFNPALFRVNYYFYFFVIILAPNLIRMAKSYKNLLVIFYILYGLYSFTLGSYQAGVRVYPYVYMWENYFEENPDVKASDFDY